MKKTKTAIFTLLLFTAFASSIYAIEQRGIGILPANPREDNERTQSIFIYESAPGSVVEDGVMVINNTKETKTILIYATDTTPSSDGAFACKQLVEEVVNEGTWYKLEKSEVTLEPNTNEIVPFKVTIPEGVSVGEHNACIVAQEKKELANNPGVNLNFRSAIRAAVTIPGDVIKKLEIGDFHYSKNENDKNQLILTLANSGNVSLDSKIKIDVNNFVTSKLFYTNSSDFTIINNKKQTLNFDIENNPWGGVYRANVTTTFEGLNGIETLTKDIVFAIIPSAYALALYIVVLIIIITAILLTLGSKKKFVAAVKDSNEYIVKEGDTFNSIAKDHNVDWKFLAKVNNKKPPFDVEVGEKILIPLIKPKNKEEEKKEIQAPVQPVAPAVVPPTTASIGNSSEIVQPNMQRIGNIPPANMPNPEIPTTLGQNQDSPSNPGI